MSHHDTLEGEVILPGDPEPQTAPAAAPEFPYPAFYVCLKADEGGKGIRVGKMVFCALDGLAKVRCMGGGDGWWNIDRNDFEARFQHAPEGEALFQAELAEAVADLMRPDTGIDDLIQNLHDFNPHVDASGEVEVSVSLLAGDLEGEGVEEPEAAPATHGEALMAPGREALVRQASTQALKRHVSLARNEVQKYTNRMLIKQNRVTGLMKLQQEIIKAKVAGLEAVVARAQEAIWTINLYLGKDEAIYLLRDGAPAPAETPITIRQLVLFMDEECAVAANSGGIDARSMEKFDQWLTEDPTHLAQVFPEPKGVVALKPRRILKDYADPWVNKQRAEEDKKTYFLIRNGEQLYRYVTDFEVGRTLLPTQSEFDAYFYEEVGDRWSGTPLERVPLKPGTYKYMEAMDRAEAKQRHYMRLGLMLQGLIDRTTIFHPLAEAVQFNDPRQYGRLIQLVFDGDAALLLTNGRETFTEWLHRTNGAMQKGHRVIGCWSNWEHGLMRSDMRKERISNQRADLPKETQIYPLEERAGRGYSFAYDGGRHYSWRSNKDFDLRARCTVYPDDTFILNIDAITEAECRYFLHSRLSRWAYTYMFPLLKAAIAVKEAERAEEAPFRLLLRGELMKTYGLDPETADREVEALVHWWKFKNPTHRSLLSDDTKALRMIVEEYGIRQRKAEGRDRVAETKVEMITTRILGAHPDAILIAHKSEYEYVALIPENDEPLFVREQLWTLRGMKEEKRWRTVDKRYERWEVLYTGPRWPEWRINISPYEVITDPELEQVTRGAIAYMQGYYDRHPELREELKSGERVFLPICGAVQWDEDAERHQLPVLYYWKRPLKSIPERLLTEWDEYHYAPEIAYVTIDWKRNAYRIIESNMGDGYYIDSRQCTFHPDAPPWSHSWDGKRRRGARALWIEEENLAYARQAAAAWEEARERRKALSSRAHRAERSLTRPWAERLEQEALQTFLAEYGDPELWEGYKKQKGLQFSVRLPKEIERAINRQIEVGESVEGLTVAELLEREGAPAPDVPMWALEMVISEKEA